MNLQRSVEDSRIINTIMEKISNQAKHHLSLESLLQGWADLVTKIEQGYDDSYYEYVNDISYRDILYDVLNELPEVLKGKIVTLIMPLDERFYQASRRIQNHLISRGMPSQQPWWFYVPITMSDELRSDLSSEGII